VNAATQTFTNNFVIGGLGWNETSGYLGALRLNSTTISGTIALTADTRITSAGTSTLSGIISGGFGMDFFEDTVIGTISLTGVNTYTGTTIVNSMGSGTTFPNLIVGNDTALGTTAGGTIVYGTGTTGTGSTLTLATGFTVTGETLTLDPTINGYRASLQTSGTATWDGNLEVAGTGGFLQLYSNTGGNLTIGSNDSDTVTGTNTLVVRGVGNGTINSALNMAGGITKTDAGTWTIASNNNSFTGMPAAASGILSVGSIADAGLNSALGAGTSITLGQNSAAAGRLQFTGASGGSSNRSLFINNGTNGAGVIENTVSGQTLTLSGALTVATPANACSLTLTGAGNGTMSGGIAGSPLMTLNKTGLGTWTISGTATHTGTTAIGDGTLVFTTVSQSLTGGLTFGTTAGSTTTGSLDLSTASATFAGPMLVQTNSATANTITIGSGQTLATNGNVTIGTNTGSLHNTDLTVTGAGSWTITNAAASGSFQIGAATGGTNTNPAVVDLSGLATFNANLSGASSVFRVGDLSTGTAVVAPSIKLAANSTITVATLGVGDNNGQGTAKILSLGTGVNTINANSILIGEAAGQRSRGTINFQHPTNGSLVIRSQSGATGTADLTLINTNNTGGNNHNAQLLMAGHTVDVSLDALVMARRTGNSTGGLGNAEITFDNGTFSANSTAMTERTGTGIGPVTGTITIGGGTASLGTVTMAVNTNTSANAQTATANLNISDGTVTATSINMANAVNTGGVKTAIGNINLSGGSLTLAGDITRTGGAGTENAIITLSGGTLNMVANDIGSGSAAITLTAESGTLSNVASINGSGGLTKTTAGTLILSGTNAYTGNTVVNDGAFELADDAQLKFVLGATSGSNNSISGAGTGTAVLNGDFNIDTTAADALLSGSWTLENVSTLTGAYGSTFSVVGFVDAGGDKWTKTVGSKKYTFDETTGILTLATAGYAAWIDGFGLTGLDALATADPDLDGIANAVEMVIGGNPATGMDTALLPTIELVNADPDGDTTFSDYLLFTYRRSDLSVAGGVTADCETDTDLVAPWTAATGAPGVVIQVDDNFVFTPPAAADTDRVRVYVPRGANTTLFGRLNVTVP
jgi:autotransporter-associated beta strand protein